MELVGQGQSIISLPSFKIRRVVILMQRSVSLFCHPISLLCDSVDVFWRPVSHDAVQKLS